jgi:N-acetylglutamate synthase/N-acetylornithine aminotransferase
MLVVLTTDYPLAEGEAEEFLRPAVARSFNRISSTGLLDERRAILLATGERRRSRRRGLRGGARRRMADLRASRGDGEGATVVLEMASTAPSTPRPRRSCAGSRPPRSSRRRRSATIPTGAGADGCRLGALR